MNTLPLDKLGPGQSGRPTYLVFGKDGPVHNPDNIRHLPIDSPEIPANGQHCQHTGSSTDAITAGVGVALCTAPPVALVALGIGIGLGVGVGIYWLFSKEESTPSTPVEEAPSVSDRLDQLEASIDEIRKEQGKLNEILASLSLPKVA